MAIAMGLGIANAKDWKNVLSSVANVAKETISQNTTVSLSDLEGTWTASSPAVVFKSSNLLQQAGGAAVTTSIEKKLKTYYKKLGLLNSTIKIASDGSFTMTLKKIPVTGTLTANSDGTFKLQLLSKLSSLSKSDKSMTVYIQKSGSEMSMTMDVKKLVNILEAIGSKTDLKTLNTITSLLSKYDGICVGFRYTK